MADSLTTLISKLQALALDDGTLFSTATCTAALRQALRQINLVLPVNAATTLDVVADQYVYELTDELTGATAIAITNVYLEDPSGGEADTALNYHAYIEDERLYFRLNLPQTSGTLLVRYIQPHTINGLDSETESTLPDSYDPILLDGAASVLCTMAATGTVEANNLDPNTSANYGKSGAMFKASYDLAIKTVSQQRLAPKGIPAARAWNDTWHTWPK